MARIAQITCRCRGRRTSPWRFFPDRRPVPRPPSGASTGGSVTAPAPERVGQLLAGPGAPTSTSGPPVSLRRRSRMRATGHQQPPSSVAGGGSGGRRGAQLRALTGFLQEDVREPGPNGGRPLGSAGPGSGCGSLSPSLALTGAGLGRRLNPAGAARRLRGRPAPGPSLPALRGDPGLGARVHLACAPLPARLSGCRGAAGRRVWEISPQWGRGSRFAESKGREERNRPGRRCS